MSPDTEFARDFCAGIGPLQLGVVLVQQAFNNKGVNTCIRKQNKNAILTTPPPPIPKEKKRPKKGETKRYIYKYRALNPIPYYFIKKLAESLFHEQEFQFHIILGVRSALKYLSISCISVHVRVLRNVCPRSSSRKCMSTTSIASNRGSRHDSYPSIN